MDAGTIYDIITLTVAATALAVTIVMANRQVRVAQKVCQVNNFTKVLLALNAECRTDDFQRSEDFVLHRLAAECATDLGISGLPWPARTHVMRVGHLYGDYAILAVLPTADPNQVLGVVHERVQRVWQALAPYAKAELESGTRIWFSYLENLAYLAARTDKREILDSQGLRQIDGSRWVAPPAPVARRRRFRPARRLGRPAPG